MGDVKKPEQLELFEGLRLTLVETPTRTRAQIQRWSEENDVELILFEPPKHFDDAILGLVRGFGQEVAVLYDEAKVIAAMVKDGMDEEQAREWFEFNTVGAYVGEATPRFLIRPWEGEESDVEET